MQNASLPRVGNIDGRLERAGSSVTTGRYCPYLKTELRILRLIDGGLQAATG